MTEAPRAGTDPSSEQHDGSVHRSGCDVVVIGAGFAGLYMLHRLRSAGFTARVFEAASDVGGVWYWNRYPGARCDVDSLDYSYSFSEELQQEWEWTERYAAQPEILAYLGHVADRFDLRRHISFDTRVTAAEYQERGSGWRIRTNRGEEVWARFFILATGALSMARPPDLEGMTSFRGATYHTGKWPHEPVDFTGLQVGVIGTGSSAVQLIPEVARDCGQLVVFQRTPNFSVPARNGPLDPAYVAEFKKGYADHRRQARWSSGGHLRPRGEKSALEVEEAERDRAYEERWQFGGSGFLLTFNDIVTDEAANETAAEFIRNKVRSIVKDPAVAEALCPKDHPYGAKRPLIDNGYYETFNRSNVSLVNLREEPIVRVVPEGIETTVATYPLDALVLATGFDAMTGAILALDIQGRDGRTLREKWKAGPVSFLGMAVNNFPNLFIVTGPGSPSVLAVMPIAIEQQVEWITDHLVFLRDRGLCTSEATEEAEVAWTEHVQEAAEGSLFLRANSWYLGANVPGKPRVFMPYVGGLGVYRDRCDEVASSCYEGFDVE